MRGRGWLTAATWFACFVGVNSCAPYGVGSSTSSAGICDTADGAVDTYQIWGKWKKISPYTPARSDSELLVNYDIMIIERGSQVGTAETPMCAASIENGGNLQTLYRATYQHNVTNKTLAVTYTEGQSGSDSIQYSFSGSCSETRLRLSHSGGTTEVYQLFSTEVNSGDCAASSN